MAEVQKTLSAQDLAWLTNRLQMPLIARDYMETGRVPEDDARFAMHELMSNLDPAKALLCAAMTLQEIALSHEGLTYLNEVCARLIHQYGPEDAVYSMESLHADLADITELMEMCRMTFEIVHPETLAFLSILIPQIEAQAMIVEEVLHRRSLLALQSENIQKRLEIATVF